MLGIIAKLLKMCSKVYNIMLNILILLYISYKSSIMVLLYDLYKETVFSTIILTGSENVNKRIISGNYRK